MSKSKEFLTEYDYFYDPDEAYSILEGYSLAANKLAEACKDKYDGDQLLFPTLFIFRHYIELSIKEIYIKYLELHDMVFSRKDIHGHYLKRIELDTLMQWVAEEYNEEFPEEILGVVTLMHDTDSKGDYFRYTHNSSGEKYRFKKLQVKPDELVASIKQVTNFFHGFYLWVDEMLEQKT